MLETANSQGFPLLSLTVFLPLAGAALLALLPRRQALMDYAVGIVTAAATLALATGMFLGYDSDWTVNAPRAAYQFADPPTPAQWLPGGITFQLGVDGVSVVLLWLTALLTLLALVASVGSVRERVREYVAMMLLLETGILGVFTALDLFLFYVFWEAALIPMILLIGIWGGRERIYASFKFLLYTMAGSALMLVAIIGLAQWAGNGSFHLFDIMAGMSRPALDMEFGIPGTDMMIGLRAALFIAFALAFAVKVPLFPFHTWLPDAHVQAPTAGSVILAGVLLKMGTYGFFRFALPIFPDVARAAVPWFMILAIVGIIYGAWVAFAQEDIKSLVAYSSVSHMGIILLGLFALNAVGMAGGVLQMVNHGITTGALFLLVGMLYDRAHTRDIAQFGGLWAAMPRYSAIFLLVMMASVGLPGTNGFVGEWLSLLGAFQARPVWGILGAVGVVLGAVYMLTMFQRVFFGEQSKLSASMPDLTMREIAVMVPLIVLILWIGIYPATFLDPIEATTTAWAQAIALAGDGMAAGVPVVPGP